MFWKAITKTTSLLVLIAALSAEVRADDGIESSALLHESVEDGPGFTQYDAGYGMRYKAAAWSILGTIVPVAAAIEISRASDADHNRALIGWLAAGGLFIGPSLGQLCARAPGQALLGIGIRGAGGLLVIAGAAQSISASLCGIDFGGDSDKKCGDGSDGEGPMILGLVTYLGGAVYSLVDGNMAVDRFPGRQEESRFGFAPTIAPGKNGATRTGASAWMRF